MKNTFPEVFSEPKFPVDRGEELNKLFEFHIDLKDPSAPPPCKKLYPLDHDELAELRK